MTFKNSDVAHGITSKLKPTYGLFKKNSDGNGGFKIISLSEGDNSFKFKDLSQMIITKSISAGAPIKLDAEKVELVLEL